MFNKPASVIVLFIIPVLFVSCDSLSPFDNVCTLEFRMIGMAVYSAEHEPVVLDEIAIFAVKSGRKTVLDICGDGYDCGAEGLAGRPDEGHYTIFHDGMRDKIRRETMKIQVEGKNENVSFSEEFVIGNNGCHVFKEAGPDTVFVDIHESTP